MDPLFVLKQPQSLLEANRNIALVCISVIGILILAFLVALFISWIKFETFNLKSWFPGIMVTLILSIFLAAIAVKVISIPQVSEIVLYKTGIGFPSSKNLIPFDKVTMSIESGEGPGRAWPDSPIGRLVLRFSEIENKSHFNWASQILNRLNYGNPFVIAVVYNKGSDLERQSIEFKNAFLKVNGNL